MKHIESEGENSCFEVRTGDKTLIGMYFHVDLLPEFLKYCCPHIAKTMYTNTLADE